MLRSALEAKSSWPGLIEAIPAALIVVDAAGRIALVNAQAEQLFGYRSEELIGQSIEQLLPARHRAEHPRLRAEFSADARPRPMGAGRELYALRKDGREVPVEIGLNPIETADGPMVLAAIADISERRRAEQQRELLIRELNHRVKNILAIVQSIAAQTLRGTDSREEFGERFSGRLAALAAAHDLLVQRSWGTIELATLLERALAVTAAPERIVLEGEPVSLESTAAVSMSLLVHELATNAVKYGALSPPAGRIEIRWALTAASPPALVVRWVERGVRPVQPPARQGFGTRLIDQVTRELGATLEREWQPTGLSLKLEMPLDAVTKAS